VNEEVTTPSYMFNAATVCGLMKTPLSLFMAKKIQDDYPDSLSVSYHWRKIDITARNN